MELVVTDPDITNHYMGESLDDEMKRTSQDDVQEMTGN